MSDIDPRVKPEDDYFCGCYPSVRGDFQVKPEEGGLYSCHPALDAGSLVRTIKKLFSMILPCLLLTGCATATLQQNDHEKALVLLSENAPAVLLVAGVPLNYYCHHNAWPKPSTIDTAQPYLVGFNNLSYALNGKDYQANFELRSFRKNDLFDSQWQMLISPPDTNFKLPQKVALEIKEDNLHIDLKSKVSIDCGLGESALAQMNNQQYEVMPYDNFQTPYATY